MPKIRLRNTETGEEQDFEPVDAREILAMKERAYEPVEQQVGSVAKDEEGNEISIPQHQGEDAEMQMGLTDYKYGRSNVVKAAPGNVVVSASVALPATEGMPEGAGQRAPMGQTNVGEMANADAAAKRAAEQQQPKEQSKQHEQPKPRGRPPGSRE
jgi:hypothetical protein